MIAVCAILGNADTCKTEVKKSLISNEHFLNDVRYVVKVNLSLIDYRPDGPGREYNPTLETDTSIAPRLGAMLYHDFVGNQLDTQVNFSGNDYAVKGASAVKNNWKVNLSMDVMSGKNLTVSAGYTRLMKSDFSSDNVNDKLKCIF